MSRPAPPSETSVLITGWKITGGLLVLIMISGLIFADDPKPLTAVQRLTDLERRILVSVKTDRKFKTDEEAAQYLIDLRPSDADRRRWAREREQRDAEIAALARAGCEMSGRC